MSTQGDPLITMNGPNGPVPSRLTKAGDGKYLLTFVPNAPTPHNIDVQFGDQDVGGRSNHVQGNPFVVKVIDGGQVTAQGRGLSGLLPVDNVTDFTVDTSRAGQGGILGINITSPTLQAIPCKVTGSGIYDCSYIPSEVGPHTITINFSGDPVPGSPFTAYVFDASAVRVGPIDDPVDIGQEVAVPIDATKAGKGTLSAAVACARKEVPCYLQSTDKDRYLLRFTPQEGRPHEIFVKHNDILVPGNPFRCNVIDGRQVSVYGDGVKRVPVGNVATFNVDTTRAGGDQVELLVSVLDPTMKTVPSKLKGSGVYTGEYIPEDVGPHNVVVTYGKNQVQGSPFVCQVYDARKVEVGRIPMGEIDAETAFNVNTTRAGEGTLTSEVTCNHRRVHSTVEEMGPGYHTVKFIPQEAETHHVSLNYNGDVVPGSPFPAEVNPPGKPRAMGLGLLKGIEGKSSEFVVDTTNCKTGPLEVAIQGPRYPATYTVDTKGNQHVVTYVPMEVGKYDINLAHAGKDVEGSPFHPVICNPAKVHIVGGANSLKNDNGRIPLMVDDMYTLPVDANGAGPGKMTARVVGPSREIPADVERRSGDRHDVTFTPEEIGEHSISVFWSEHHITDSPLYGDAGPKIDARRVVLSGKGLKEAKVDEVAEFLIDGSEAGNGVPESKLVGQRGNLDVTLVPDPRRKNSYRALYCPAEPGHYKLNVHWSDKEVKGSPFDVKITQAADANQIAYTGAKKGELGQSVKGILDPRKAGSGKLTAKCVGPTRNADVSLSENANKTINVSMRPKETGLHKLHIKCNGQHIPGSPFEINVDKPPDPSKVKVFGPGLTDGKFSSFDGTFLCDTREAGPGQLKVRIEGPQKDAFRMTSDVLNDVERTVRVVYTPHLPGDYDVEVKWSDVHVPGSPFHVKVLDDTPPPQPPPQPQQRTRPSNLVYEGPLAANPVTYIEPPQSPVLSVGRPVPNQIGGRMAFPRDQTVMYDYPVPEYAARMPEFIPRSGSDYRLALVPDQNPAMPHGDKIIQYNSAPVHPQALASNYAVLPPPKPALPERIPARRMSSVESYYHVNGFPNGPRRY
ncbi:filamin-A-like isoform X2 [Branchiostoma floridae x Branchiostoma belcheri]